MSENKLVVEVEMVDATKSLDNLDNKGKRLNKTLERTKEIMAGTKGGSKAANAAYGQTEYNTARGTIGTGASGRDFAKQSRELDGLVRLYAVYAANIFAAEAAFRALSEAMNTTNMIEGLNQLGAASGVAMGGLAKRFAEASGGAISLRESMEATAKAVSSGMTQSQFLKLGEVAKKASQALGINMSDAVSRLTRGITKLEPELLDELGIFTKVGKATEDYARAINKPVSELTDFEKRQAFANAVLAEGAKKFGEINIPTNPYDKLLATLKNVAQLGLELVNNVLGPFATLLSNNTGLLVGALGLIGVKLIKDALPAVGQWRQGLKLAADEAKKTSSDIAASFGEAFVERTNAAFKVPDLERNLKASEDAYRASRTKMAQMDTDFSKRVLKGGPATDDKSLKSEQSKITREINNLKKQGLAVDSAQIVALEKQKDTVVALRNAIKETNAAKNAALDKSESGGGSLFERFGDWLRASSAKGARDKSARLDILSNVSKNQTEKGFGPAIGLMMKDLDALPSKFQKVRTGIAGIVIAGAGSVGTAISGLSRFLGPVGIGLGILQAALPLFRRNEEDAARFAASLDLLKENSENAFRVLERLSKLDPLERISIDNINAKAVALESIGSSLTKAFDDFETELKNRNWADSTINFLAGLIGRSSEDLLTKQVSTSLERAVKLAGSGEQARAMQEQIAETLKLPANASMGAIEDALEKASPEIKNAVGKIIEDSGKKAVASSGSFKAFRESLTESGKIYQDLLNTTRNDTPLSKFAEDSTKKIIEFNKVLSGGTLLEQLATLKDYSTNINFLQLFPPEAAKSILSTSMELSKLSDELAEVENRQTLYNNALADQQKIVDKYKNSREGSLTGSQATELSNAKKSIDQLKELNSGLTTSKDNISSQLQASSETFSKAMRDGLIANIKIFTQGIVDAAARANIEIKKAALGGVTSEEQKAKLDLKLQNQSFSLDKLMLDRQAKLIDSNMDLKIAIMENTLAQTIANSGVQRKPGETADQATTRLTAEEKDIANKKTTLEAYKLRKNDTLPQLLKELESLSNSRGAGDKGLLAGIALSVEGAKARQDLQASYKALEGKQGAANITGQFSVIEGTLQDRLKLQSQGEAALDLDMQALERERARLTESEFLARKTKIESDKQDFIRQKALLNSQAILAKAEIAANAYRKDDPKESDKILNNAKILSNEIQNQAESQASSVSATAAQTVNIASQLEAFDKIERIKAAEAKTTTDILTAQIDEVTAAQNLLNILRDQGKVDDESFKKQSDSLATLSIILDREKQLADIAEGRRSALAAIARKETEAGGPLTGAAKAVQEADIAKINKDADVQVAAVQRVSKAREEAQKMITDQARREAAYTELFKQAFKGMEDAIVNFVKTGKLSFKDMINSFIEGLLRFEIQQQQIKLFSGLDMAGGLAKLFISTVGMSAGVPLTPELKAGFDIRNAKGGVYDTGLRTFAKGGMFTNSIVSQPTLFKFARGTGLMGEAGPEAIMPLKRDSNGNLGVRSNQGKVDVVVNNYSNQQAKTKETTDSRGNRRIEVIVGDMVAGELNRVGSTTQQAMTASYGTSPLLARR
jgi:phage-related minor tail protein